VEAGVKRRGRKRRGVLRLVGWLFLLLASLAVVAWRQTEGFAREQALREVQTEREIAEAERVALERRVQALTARARIVRVARERLGMRLPSDGEIVLLPEPRERAGERESGRGRPQ
jgi:cell division protein FtsL